MKIDSLFAAAMLAALSQTASAGAFILGNGAGAADQIMHARGYPTGVNPVGGNYLITVCLDPGTTPLAAEQPVRNVVAEFNRMQGANSNVVSGNGQPDFESMLLHELGHCMGMDHNTLGPSELSTGSLANPQLYFTNSRAGTNGVYDTAAGVDTVRASRDDLRLDDINQHWYRSGVNDPFAALPAVIDQATYAISLLGLPVGHTYVEAATSQSPCTPAAAANTSALRGVNGTSSVMVPVLCSNNFVRKLARDDVATLRIARAGYNGVQGNADDYTWTMQYVGRTLNCNIPITLVPDDQTGFAQCGIGFVSPGNGSSDSVITSGLLKARASQNWFYNQNDTTGALPGSCIFRGGFEATPTPCN